MFFQPLLEMFSKYPAHDEASAKSWFSN